jgi:hypothetical protein
MVMGGLGGVAAGVLLALVPVGRRSPRVAETLPLPR